MVLPKRDLSLFCVVEFYINFDLLTTLNGNWVSAGSFRLAGTPICYLLYNLPVLEIYRESTSSEADWIEADLKDLVVGYERLIVTPSAAEHILGHPVKLPVLRDGDRWASGREDILAFLKDIHKMVEDWRKFQGDSCYIDDDGQVC